MEKEKRRKKLDGRVDAETIINELMEGVDLDKAAHEDAESKLDRYENNFESLYYLYVPYYITLV